MQQDNYSQEQQQLQSVDQMHGSGLYSSQTEQHPPAQSIQAGQEQQQQYY